MYYAVIVLKEVDLVNAGHRLGPTLFQNMYQLVVIGDLCFVDFFDLYIFINKLSVLCDERLPYPRFAWSLRTCRPVSSSLQKRHPLLNNNLHINYWIIFITQYLG